MALALMGLLAVAALGPNESAFSGLGDEPLDETLRKAVREARFQAVNTGAFAILFWDAQTYSFVIKDATGNELERMKSDAKGEKDDIKFFAVAQIQGTEPVEAEPVLVETDSILFDADRCATPFEARMHYAGEDMTVRYDACSNLKLEMPK
jgi:hypothetical protein